MAHIIWSIWYDSWSFVSIKIFLSWNSILVFFVCFYSDSEFPSKKIRRKKRKWLFQRRIQKRIHRYGKSHIGTIQKDSPGQSPPWSSQSPPEVPRLAPWNWDKYWVRPSQYNFSGTNKWLKISNCVSYVVFFSLFQTINRFLWVRSESILDLLGNWEVGNWVWGDKYWNKFSFIDRLVWSRN